MVRNVGLALIFVCGLVVASFGGLLIASLIKLSFLSGLAALINQPMLAIGMPLLPDDMMMAVVMLAVGVAGIVFAVAGWVRSVACFVVAGIFLILSVLCLWSVSVVWGNMTLVLIAIVAAAICMFIVWVYVGQALQLRRLGR